jgi:hypothetical protein
MIAVVIGVVPFASFLALFGMERIESVLLSAQVETHE